MRNIHIPELQGNLPEKISTAEFAAFLRVSAKTPITALCRNGHYLGLRPLKLASGRLLWDLAEVRQLISVDGVLGAHKQLSVACSNLELTARESGSFELINVASSKSPRAILLGQALELLKGRSLWGTKPHRKCSQVVFVTSAISELNIASTLKRLTGKSTVDAIPGLNIRNSNSLSGESPFDLNSIVGLNALAQAIGEAWDVLILDGADEYLQGAATDLQKSPNNAPHLFNWIACRKAERRTVILVDRSDDGEMELNHEIPYDLWVKCATARGSVGAAKLGYTVISHIRGMKGSDAQRKTRLSLLKAENGKWVWSKTSSGHAGA